MTGEQNYLIDEIIADNFAGGGGASTGIELATGRVCAIAINHDPDAILMHKTNHPLTEHFQASVWDIDPVEVCRGRPVGLAWFSPDCKHFSKAKGSALVDRNIRGLAWIVLRWAARVRPRVIILENVEEFTTWGPVRKGKPVKQKAGQTYAQWKRQLEGLGYDIDSRLLVAADYGAPTSRKRFVLVARCDGRPIAWPERTHAPADSEEVRSGKCLPWRSAAEIIDWSIPCPSIFASKQEIKEQYGISAVRPLADNTLRRIVRGVDKFTIRAARPFIVPVGYGERAGQLPRVHDIDAPLSTVVSSTKQNVCEPKLSPFSVECNHSGGGHVAEVDEPYKTITAKHTGGVCTPVLSPCVVQDKFQNGARSAEDPLSTVTAVGSHELCTANLIQYHTEQTENVRANGVEAPIPTVDASNRYGLTVASLVEYYGNGQPIDVSEPLRTVTSHDREALASVHVQKYFDGAYKGCGDAAERPLSTVTALPRHGVCAAHIAEFKGSDLGQNADRSLRTVTASAGEFGIVSTQISKYEGGVSIGHWPQVRSLLNKYCDYNLAENELLLINISGAWYFISDIGLRMLTPRELYNAMGFPADYIIDCDYLGNAYGKTKQVARCGNAVCPPMAEAVVRANLPEWCGAKIYTMKQFGKRLFA